MSKKTSTTQANKKPKNRVSPQTVGKIAEMAQIPLKEGDRRMLAGYFEEILETTASLLKTDTKDCQPTYQVTGLQNVWRDDNVDKERMLSQKEALKNAVKTYQGYFVVKPIINPRRKNVA